MKLEKVKKQYGMKEILVSWKSSMCINESRLYTISPDELLDIDISKSSAGPQHLDKTGMSEEEAIRDIINIVIEHDEDVALSFISQYEDGVAPGLGINPVINYSTPHGIYSYPLGKANIEQFLYTGIPTNADFASDLEYFHIIEPPKSSTINIGVDGSTNYDNKNYVKDCKELSRIFLYYVIEGMSKKEPEYFDKATKGLNNDSLYDVDISDLSSTNKKFYEYLLKFCYDLYKNGYDNQKRIDDSAVLEVASFLNRISMSSINEFNEYVEYDKFYSTYFIADYLSSFFTDVGFNFLPAQKAGLFAIFINAVGIKHINDVKGTSVIHPAEASQSVYTNITNSSDFVLLGTYLNKKFNRDLVSKILEEYYEKGLLSTAKTKMTFKGVDKDKFISVLSRVFVQSRYTYHLDLHSDTEEIGFALEDFIADRNEFEDVLEECENSLSQAIQGLCSEIVDFSKENDYYLNISSEFYKTAIKEFLLGRGLNHIKKTVIEQFIDCSYIKRLEGYDKKISKINELINFINEFMNPEIIKSTSIYENFLKTVEQF